MDLEERVEVLKALADPYRLRILDILSPEIRCNCHLQDQMEIAPNLLSYHLKILREAGLIVGTKRGRWIWPYLLVGIAIGAVIHGWAPEDFFAGLAGSGNPLAVPFAVLLGIPLYSSAAGVIPLVQALSDKGVALGTVLAFMMAVVALSLPEMILLRRVLQPKLLATFVGVVGTGILAVGYLFNVVI